MKNARRATYARGRGVGTACWKSAALVCGLFLSGATLAAAVSYSDVGATAADLTGGGDALTRFRSDLGANNGVGPAAGVTAGRREINWDAPALDAVADPNFMPNDQFNRLAAPFARGAQFSTPGSGFLVSRRCEQDGGAAPCGGGNILFGLGGGQPNNVNLQAFSAQRIFAPVGSNKMDVTFDVAGSPGTRASVSAFGAIFLDVEVANLTTMEFFDLAGSSLGVFAADSGADASMSFLGVRFDAGEAIGRVRLTLGDMILTGHGSLGPTLSDYVALDDFIYSEPKAVAEPGILALIAAGLLAGVRRRRRS